MPFWVYRADRDDFTVVGESRDIDYVPVSALCTVVEMLSHYEIWTNGKTTRNRQDVATAGCMLLVQNPSIL